MHKICLGDQIKYYIKNKNNSNYVLITFLYILKMKVFTQKKKNVSHVLE